MPASRTLAKLAIRGGFVNDPTKVILSDGTSGPPPNPGSYTTLSLTGNVASTSTTTGTLIVTGGVGVSGAGYFGGGLNVTGSTGGPIVGLNVSNQSFANNAYAIIQLSSQGSRSLTLSLPGSGVGATEQGRLAAVNCDLQFVGQGGNPMLIVKSDRVTLPSFVDADFAGNGALSISGGLYCAKKIRAGDDIGTSGNLTAGGTLTTGAPGHGASSAAWLLGDSNAGGGAPGAPDSTIIINIGGNDYALAARVL
jgi:hypothetical protein